MSSAMIRNRPGAHGSRQLLVMARRDDQSRRNSVSVIATGPFFTRQKHGQDLAVTVWFHSRQNIFTCLESQSERGSFL
jgi:hypothetical protein